MSNVLVPLEPTKEMLDAGNAADYAASTSHVARIVYKAMLAAAPPVAGVQAWAVFDGDQFIHAIPDEPKSDWLAAGFTCKQVVITPVGP